jgi:glucose/arabinose dehydrogenase
LSKGPGDSIFTGGKDGAVHRIDAEGHVSVFASGFGEVRGIAYDPSGRRLFLVDHAPARDKSGKKSALLIRPVP